MRLKMRSPWFIRRKRFIQFVLILVATLLFCEIFLFNPNPANLNSDFSYILVPYSSSTSPLFLVVFVISSSSNFVARSTIRKTWANAKLSLGMPRIVVFVLGKPSNQESQKKIQQEANANGDILQGDFFDTKRTLPLKTIMMLRWASNARFEYILKTDDDMYVHMSRLTNWLRTRDATQWLYAGKRRENASVTRLRLAAYPVAYEEFSEAHYPYYCYGGFYILSGKMLPKLMEAHRNHKLFPVEDAYVGVLTKYIGVTPKNIYPKHLMLERGSRWKSIDYRKCKFTEVFAFGDSLDPDSMLHIHKSMENLGNQRKGGLFTCTEQ